MVTGLAPAGAASIAPVAVGVVVFAAARLALLPGLGYWDTAEYQAVGPLLGHGPPDRLPDLGDPRLARVGRAAAVRRPGVPDEPAGGDLPRRGGRHDRRPGPDPDPLDGARRPRRPGSGARSRRLGDRHACRDARASTSRSRRSCCACWSAGRIGPAIRRPSGRPGPTAGSSRRPSSSACRWATTRSPCSWRHRSRCSSSRSTRASSAAAGWSPRCAAVLAVTIVVLYLELPLRAGPFRAPLVYGRPETLDGFWYVVLAEQFQGSVVDPFGDLGGKVLTLVTRATGQFGPLTAAHPARLPRHRRPASAVRAADRVHRRHHVVLRRVLRERRHRALLPRAVADGLDLAGDPRRVRRDGRRPTSSPARATSWRRQPTPRYPAASPRSWPSGSPSSSSPRPLVAVPARYRAVNESARPVGGPLGGSRPAAHGARCAHRELVEPLHAAMVCTARRRSTAGPEDRRRQDHPGRRTGRHLHGDRCEPRGPPRLRHPRRREPGRRAGPPLRAGIHRGQLGAVPDPGHRPSAGTDR